MSLKARIEAVIYAAEEPVTMAQLAALFAVEALDEAGLQAEAAEATGAEDAAAAGKEAGALEFAQPELESKESAPEAAEEPQAQPVEPAPDAEAAGTPAAATEETGTPESGARQDGAQEAAESDSAADPAPGEAQEKAQARQRDREIRATLRSLLDELIAEYEAGDRGLEIREVAGGYRFQTKPEYHDSVRGFIKSLKPPMKLSLPALETLAVVAYKQPITAPEVAEIRGVESAGVLGSLVARKLVTTAGRKQVVGRPILYKTTREFLLRFGLKDLSELPSMEEFEKMAGELEDSGADGAEGVAAAPREPELPLEDGVDESTEPESRAEASPAESTEQNTAEADESFAESELQANEEEPSVKEPAVDEPEIDEPEIDEPDTEAPEIEEPGPEPAPMGEPPASGEDETHG